MASTLGLLGFDVINVRDGSSDDMTRAVESFLKRLGQNDVGLFYFSGHGVEYAGRNYLLPINLNTNEPEEIPRFGLDVTRLIERLSRAEDKLSIIVVDACRNNPVRSKTRQLSAGLSEIKPARGALIGFSTGPGMVAEDGQDNLSPYTKHLAKNLMQKGLKVESIFKITARDVEIETAGRQIPWYSSNLRLDFSLH
jgi:uncharacterized caspase-like protein